MPCLALVSLLLAASRGTPVDAACHASSPKTPLHAAVKRRDLDWGRALTTRDRALLEELLDDEFTLTNPSGGLTSKQDHIRDIVEGRFVITSHEMDDVCVRVYGDTAVVTARVRTAARNRTRDLSGEFRTIRVYVRRGSVWKLVAHQATRNALPADTERPGRP